MTTGAPPPPAPPPPGGGAPPVTFTQTAQALGGVVDRLTVWLLDLGTWLLGAMVAFNLVILAALLTVGPVDRAVLIASCALAVALPPAVSAFALLRLVRDVQQIGLEEAAIESFRAAGVEIREQIGEGPLTEIRRRRTQSALRFSYLLLGVSVLLTLTGTTACLWHMGWWIAVAFMVAVAASLAVVGRGVAMSPRSQRTKRR